MYMGDFKQKVGMGRGRFGGERRTTGGYSSGGRKSFGDRDGKPEMHKVICSDCGKNCEVPFRPSGDRKVFCSECFGGKEEGGRSSFRGNFGGSRERRPSSDFKKDSSLDFSQIKEKLMEISSKMDVLIDILGTKK